MNALIESDVEAIASNVERMRSIAGTDAIVVVKANGYGHGALLAAEGALRGGAVQLAVADIGEALALRSAGIQSPLLAWLHSARADFAAARDADIDVGVSSLRQLERAGECGSLHVHLKFDTGLGRNGIPLAEWDAVIARAHALQSAGRLRVTGLMSHLAGAGSEADDWQRVRFAEAISAAERLDADVTHLCASAGTLDSMSGSLARFGVSAYGLDPDGHDADGSVAGDLRLRPALRLTAPVRGGRLAYGYRHGLLTTDVPVLIGDRRIAIVEASANESRLDSPVDGTAVLIGSAENGEPTAGEWAAAAGTINYEIVTRLSPAIERRAA
ncbi:MAG TPA: alanine racemase [Candidatus Agrococcus pullicola]|uniref:Alanine racemase n=1 Tax=Candidatus Agrococcus pullicola TaxID=2838429 RepID=A0A9D1YSI6_9MICO|nr:alanine racemase [Candidatus Agrococcus pullicola]